MTRRRRRRYILPLALVVILAAAIRGHRALGPTLGSSRSEPVEVTVYVHDATGGCPNSLALCDRQDIVEALERRYRGYLEAAGLGQSVTLEVKNLRMQHVRAEVAALDDPALDAHLIYPYPLFVVNGVYRRNMDKSRRSFYETLSGELPGWDRRRLEKYMAEAAADAVTEDVIVYFYRPDSSVHDDIEGYLAACDPAKIERHDLTRPEEQARYGQYVSHYPSIEDDVGFGRMEPAVFVNDAYLQGPVRIRDYFADKEAGEPFATLRPAGGDG